MKKFKAMILLLFFFSAAFCLYSGGFSFQADFVSRYIWRGFDLNPPKKPIIQPQVTYAFGDSGFAINLWCNFSFEDKNSNEVDFTFSYDFKTVENFALSIGFINYDWIFRNNFSVKNDTTQEFYVSANLPEAFLNPKITIYYDITNGDGLYAELGIGHSVELSKNLTADLSGSLGYNAGQWLPDGADKGFSDLNLGAAIPIKTGKVTITPYAAYTFVFLDAVSADNHFWFGISIAR